VRLRRLPLDGVELRIGDGTRGVEGEVLVRGPMLLRGYRDGTDPRIAGGWFPTGDGGRLEADGTLVVFGRMAEVIVTGPRRCGRSRWRTSWRPPAVAEVAVWKRPDPVWGERVVAWVVPVPGVPAPELSELRDLVAGRWPGGPLPGSSSWSRRCPAPPAAR